MFYKTNNWLLIVSALFIFSSCFLDPQGRKDSTFNTNLLDSTGSNTVYQSCPQADTLPVGCTCDDSDGPVVITCQDCNAIEYDQNLCTCDSGVIECNGTVVVDPDFVSTPSFSPFGGTFASAQSVSISSATSGASIYYTTNGTDPACGVGTQYSSPISVSTGTTVKAIACMSGMGDSNIAQASYVISMSTVANPVLLPAAGTYASATSVAMSSGTSGATIYYRTDGVNPACGSGTVYSSAVTFSSSTTFKSIACKSGMADSSVITSVYKIKKFTYQGDEGWIPSPYIYTSGANSFFFTSGKFNSDTKTDIFGTLKTFSATSYLPRGWFSSGSVLTSLSSPGGGVTISNGGGFSGDDFSAVSGFVTGDFNGNGFDDIAAVGIKNGDSFFSYQEYPQIFVKDIDGNFPWDNFHSAYNTSSPLFEDIRGHTLAGKFNNDSRADIIVLKKPNSITYEFWAFYAETGATATSFDDPMKLTVTVSPSGTIYSGQIYDVVSADFNNDGKTDIAGIYRVSTTESKILVWINNGAGGFTVSPNGWWSGAVNQSYTSGRVIAGDFNGDGKKDLAAALYDASCSYKTKLIVWLSTGSSFASPVTWWESGCNGYNPASIKGFVSGNFDGDNDDDIMGFYNYGTTVRAHVWLSTE